MPSAVNPSRWCARIGIAEAQPLHQFDLGRIPLGLDAIILHGRIPDTVGVAAASRKVKKTVVQRLGQCLDVLLPDFPVQLAVFDGPSVSNAVNGVAVGFVFMQCDVNRGPGVWSGVRPR